MSLTSPFALIALAAASAPVVIYLILRRRKSEIAWGASYILRLTLASRRKSSLWKQLIVLAARVAMLASAVLLLAGPVRPNPRPAADVPELPPGPVHRVVLVDHSVSMTADDGRGVRLECMRRAADALLAQLRTGDVATLVSLLSWAGPPEAVTRTVSGPVGPRRRAQLLDDFAPREGDLDLGAALAAAFSALARTRRAAAEIYAFSDFPRDMAGGMADLPWVAEAASSRQARLAPVRFAGADEGAPNVAIRSLEIGSDLVPAGVPVKLYVDAVSYSDEETTATFEVERDGSVVARESVAFRADERRRVPIELTFERPGTTLVRVRVDRSRLPRLGERALSLTVAARLTVWAVTESASAMGANAPGETEFLLRALSGKNGEAGAFETVPVSPSKLRSEIPDDVDVIVVAGMRFALAASASPLARFVARGGGLIFSMSAEVETTGYNEHYAELLPAGLAGPARASVDPERFALVRAEPADAAGALFEEFGKDAALDLGQVRVFNHMRVEVDGTHDGAPDGTVFSLDDESPFLMSRRRGRGRVFLLTSSLGIAWNALPVRRCFIPFVMRLLHAAADGRALRRNVCPEQRVVLAWDGDAAAELVAPDGTVRTLRPTSWAGRSYIVVDRHEAPGLYRVDGGDERRPEHFTVRGDMVEGDLRTLRGDASARLEQTLGVRLYDGWDEAVEALGPADALSEAWPAILVLMLLVYVFEAWFVRKL